MRHMIFNAKNVEARQKNRRKGGRKAGDPSEGAVWLELFMKGVEMKFDTVDAVRLADDGSREYAARFPEPQQGNGDHERDGAKQHVNTAFAKTF